MNERLAQLFGIRLAAFALDSNGARGPIGCHYGRMVDRDVRGAALEITHGIAAGRHELLNQLIRFGNSATRIINKEALHALPSLTESCRHVRTQWQEFQFRDAGLAFAQLGFGSRLPAVLLHSSFVFGAIVLL